VNLNLIHMPQYDDHQYESGREIKQRFLATRKHDSIIGATSHPGLFQTANTVGDAFGLILALGLETYGLANLMRIGSIELTAALALVAVDILGALLAHFRQGNLCRIHCMLAVAHPSEKARIGLRDRLRDRAIRGLGTLMIAGAAAWKITSFASIGSLNETPSAIIALMGLVYISAAFLHWRCTGYAIAHAWLTLGLEMERRRTLGEDPATAKCGIHGPRIHNFDSPLPLKKCTVNGHALVAIGGTRYTLRTEGLLTDHELATLAAAQDCLETRNRVSREGLRAQLTMLDEEPMRPSKTLGTLSVEKDEQTEPQVSSNGTERRTASFARHAVLLAFATAITSVFSGCGNPPTPKRVVEMKVIVPASVLTDGHALPEALIDLLAPANPATANGKAPVVIPAISLMVTGGRKCEPVTIKSKADPGRVARSYGADAPGWRQLASIREQLLALKLELNSAPATGPNDHVSPDGPSMEEFVLDKEGKPQGKALAFEPGVKDTPPVMIGNNKVPAFGDATEISRVIADAVAVGESKFTLLYAVKDLLSPPSTELAQVVEAKPPVAQETPPEELPSKPRIVSLNENYTHAALVDHAESQLMIKFNSGSSELNFEAVKEIEQLAKKAATIGPAPGQWIVIGYADGKGTEELRDHLSLDRGLRTAAEMSSCGMKVAIVAGAGSTRPAGPNETATGRAQNRRVIIYWKPSTATN
jgi:outer membrane protein OmpA-like peptidoglycan-associated protein